MQRIRIGIFEFACFTWFRVKIGNDKTGTDKTGNDRTGNVKTWHHSLEGNVTGRIMRNFKRLTLTLFL